MDFLPLYEFNKCVKRYHGDRKVQSFTCLNQFYAMAFADLAQTLICKARPLYSDDARRR